MPGEHLALANISSGSSAIGAEQGGRGGGLRIWPLEGDAHRSDLKAECAVGPGIDGTRVGNWEDDWSV
jgi:hypothetical protein